MWTVFAFSEHQDRYVDTNLYRTTNKREASEVMQWLQSIGWRVGIQEQGGK